jgi:hypothetical protein
MVKSKRPRKPSPRAAKPRAVRVYTLEIYLISGPLSDEFVSKNPVVCRTVQIRADQTLADLHEGIWSAFGRTQDQMYEFQVGPIASDRVARRFVLPGALGMTLDGTPPPVGLVTDTTLDAVALSPGQRFSYWFDFAADWWHQVRVKAVERKQPRGRYPKVTRRLGEDPPQPSAEDLRTDADPRVISGDQAADVSCLIGEMHLSKGDFGRAIEAFTRAIDNQPTADAYLGRARAYRGLAERDEQRAQR